MCATSLSLSITTILTHSLVEFIIAHLVLPKRLFAWVSHILRSKTSQRNTLDICENLRKLHQKFVECIAWSDKQTAITTKPGADFLQMTRDKYRLQEPFKLLLLH